MGDTHLCMCVIDYWKRQVLLRLLISIISIRLDQRLISLNNETQSFQHLYFQEGRKLGYSSMTGVPMVATSPMRHDLPPTTPNPLNPVEIQGYEPPWKALCDFALNSDLDRPGYNHLVNEVSFFLSQTPGAPGRRGARVATNCSSRPAQ